jgi:hypothetical protein
MVATFSSMTSNPAIRAVAAPAANAQNTRRRSRSFSSRAITC